MRRQPKPKDGGAAPPVAADPEPQADAVLDPALELVAVKSLAGDIRDFLLDRLKNDHSALPWNVRGEVEQARYIEQATDAAERLVRKVAQLVATKERPFIGSRIHKAALKDHIALELHVGLAHPLRHALLDAVGAEVLIVLSGVEEFMGARGKVAVNRDQASFLPEDEGDGEVKGEPPAGDPPEPPPPSPAPDGRPD